MADCLDSKTRRKRAKNQRRRQKKSNEAKTIQTENEIEIINGKEDYKVDFPDSKSSKPKLKIKSKSLDDDDEAVKIQEVEGSVEEENHQCEAIVTEAESDWEQTTDLRVPQSPVSLSTVALTIDEEPLQRIGNFSPEEELSLRNFLEGINLINSPSFLSSTSTLDSIQKEKVRKRDALMKYFTPLVHNPRFLDIISEEGSDLSDRESYSLTRHLKQGTPELENKNISSVEHISRSNKRNQLRRLQLNRNEDKAVLVCTKILEMPSVIEHIHSCTDENVEPEMVYLDSSSDNTSSENSSRTGKSTPSEKEEIYSLEGEQQEEFNEIQNANMEKSVPDLKLTGVKSEDALYPDGIFLNSIIMNSTDVPSANSCSESISIELSTPSLVETAGELIDGNKLQLYEIEVKDSTDSNCLQSVDDVHSPIEDRSSGCQNAHSNFTELTPPPTPEHLSPKKKLSTDSIDLDLNESMDQIVRDTAKDITSVLCKLDQGFQTTFIVNQATVPPPENATLEAVPTYSPSLSGSSSRETSPSTVRMNLMTSSIADVASISADLEIAKQALNYRQPPTLRHICLAFLLTSSYGERLMQEFNEVSMDFEKFAEAGNETKEKLTSDASFNEMTLKDANNSTLISEGTAKLKKIMASQKWAGIPFYNNPNLVLYLTSDQKVQIGQEGGKQKPAALGKFPSKIVDGLSNLNEMKNIEITTHEKETMHKTSDISYSMSTSKTLPKSFKSSNNNPRLQVCNLDEWLNIARNNEESVKEKQMKQTELKNPKRRTSLPDDIYQRQLQMILQKEKEIEKELETLLEEKRQLYVEMRTTQENLSEGNYEKARPKSFPQSPSETLRQKMYEEYMKEVAEREERKYHKMIKLTSTSKHTESDKSQFEAVHLPGIEDEFMKKVQERHGTLDRVEETLEKEENEEKEKEKEVKTPSVLLIDGKSVKEASDLPWHLREFVEITTDFSEESKAKSEDGIWSPGQKQESVQSRFDKQLQKDDESIPSIWQPKSATSSPIAERKEFRPVSFESPRLNRKNQSQEVHKSSEKLTTPPVREPVSRVESNRFSTTTERGIPSSRSAPVSTGLSEFTTTRLPKAQNPTVVLLQKAREGQLPKGASYLESSKDHYRIPHDFSVQGEINHPRINDRYTESDSEIILNPEFITKRKLEGVGPVTSDGMPLSLRSEVRDTNQSKWYKKMYDTIHKQKPYRAQYPYISGYLSEPEPGTYESGYMDQKYATLDRRRTPLNEKENFTTSTLPRNLHNQWKTASTSDYSLGSKSNPGRIENYIPGHTSIFDQESKKWWDEVMDIFDGKVEDDRKSISKGYLSQALKESGYESDSTLVFRKKDDGSQISPLEQKEAYKIIQKGGDVPLHGLRKPAPERPKEPEPPVPPPKSHQGLLKETREGSPRKYVENQVTIHYKTPVRQEVKDYFSEDELAHRQQEAMKKIYQEEKRRKYLQELQDIHNRRHTDNFIPSQKSPIPLNRYDDFDQMVAPQHRIRPRSPEPRLVARALYNFVGMTPRELTFRKGDNIYVRRQIDKNWYEGELNAMVGLFPVNYVEIIPYEAVKTSTTARKSFEGQARAKFNFLAKTHLELSLAKGEMVILTRRVDNNWYEGKIGGRKGIFPASYVDVMIDPQEPMRENPKAIASPAAHSLLLNGSSVRDSMGSHTYSPNVPNPEQSQAPSYYAKPIQTNYCNNYGARNTAESRNPLNQALHVDTQPADPLPYKALYKYLPQNSDELELMENDTVYVLEKCDDGWFVGSNERTGAFGTFPGNYVEKV